MKFNLETLAKVSAGIGIDGIIDGLSCMAEPTDEASKEVFELILEIRKKRERVKDLIVAAGGSL